MNKKTYQQKGRFSSPYTWAYRLKVLLWGLVQTTIFRTPKPLNRWRLFLLRCFGAGIEGSPFVSGWCTIKAPWNLKIGHKACLGPHSEIYNLNLVSIGERALIAQHVYLCGGSHDYEDPNWPLITAPIFVGCDVFIGAKSIVLMGVSISDFAVIGAGCVVAKDVPEATICVGNPCRFIGIRKKYQDR